MEQLTTTKPEFEISLEKPKHSRVETFDELFLQAVDEAFLILGEQNKQLIYNYLEKSHGISKEAIPINMQQFGEAIEGVFGEPARLIEIEIMRALHRKVPSFIYDVGENSLSFVGYVLALRVFL